MKVTIEKGLTLLTSKTKSGKTNFLINLKNNVNNANVVENLDELFNKSVTSNVIIIEELLTFFDVGEIDTELTIKLYELQQFARNNKIAIIASYSVKKNSLEGVSSVNAIDKCSDILWKIKDEELTILSRKTSAVQKIDINNVQFSVN